MPGVWRYLFGEDFPWLKVPEERHSTCDDCPKVKLGEYRDDCRCCTYYPELANFLVGLALMSDSREAIVPLIRSHSTVPIGLAPSPQRYKNVVEAYAQDRFGEEPWMLCPFVDKQTFHCKIYPFRNSVCSTYFCTNDHGEIGNEFWGKLQNLAGNVEMSLSQYCMDKVGLSHKKFVASLDELSEVDIPSLSNADDLSWSEHASRTLWGDWYGREVEFFEACAQVVLDERENLFDIARTQPERNALKYEENVRLSIAEKHRHAAPVVADTNSPHRGIYEHRYKLQVLERRVWQLPIQQGLVRLSEAVEILENPRDDAWNSECPQEFMVRSLSATADSPDINQLYSSSQVALLRYFESPQLMNEAFFAHPLVAELEAARELLAQWLRLGILVETQ